MLDSITTDPEVQRARDEAYREAARADVRAGSPPDMRLWEQSAYAQEYTRLPKPMPGEIKNAGRGSVWNGLTRWLDRVRHRTTG